jgi:hypothetical protein
MKVWFVFVTFDNYVPKGRAPEIHLPTCPYKITKIQHQVFSISMNVLEFSKQMILYRSPYLAKLPENVVRFDSN